MSAGPQAESTMLAHEMVPDALYVVETLVQKIAIQEAQPVLLCMHLLLFTGLSQYKKALGGKERGRKNVNEHLTVLAVRAEGFHELRVLHSQFGVAAYEGVPL